MPSPVVLINAFEVAEGMEDEFLVWWKNCTEALKKEPGFINARLHRSLNAGSRFQFINVAHWETEEAFVLARTKNRDILQATSAAKGTPTLCEVALQY